MIKFWSYGSLFYHGLIITGFNWLEAHERIYYSIKSSVPITVHNAVSPVPVTMPSTC